MLSWFWIVLHYFTVNYKIYVLAVKVHWETTLYCVWLFVILGFMMRWEVFHIRVVKNSCICFRGKIHDLLAVLEVKDIFSKIWLWRHKSFIVVHISAMVLQSSLEMMSMEIIDRLIVRIIMVDLVFVVDLWVWPMIILSIFYSKHHLYFYFIFSEYNIDK